MRITIDQNTIDVPEGTTVLKAAELLGIAIPTMCFMEGTDCSSSCMVCLVKDLSSGNMFPSCAMPVREGMNIQTRSPEIREMRRQALELLLGDHIGDCEAPCRLSCPAFMNIPLMNRLIAGGHFTPALDIVREEIAIPLILGYICPAPCEKACHRTTLDEAVSICILKRKTAQDDRLQPLQPRENASGNGRPVAVIGSGPAGLSAAFYLRRMGYDVTIYDKNPLPGGTLRYDVPEDELPRESLNREIETIGLMGVQFISGTEVDATMFENEIVPRFLAIILATGNCDINSPSPFSLLPDDQGNLINRKTGATSRPGIFGCGSLIREQRMAVRSAAQGKLAALEADLFLNTGHTRRIRFQFHSAISHLLPGEEREYLKEAAPYTRIHPEAGLPAGFSDEEAMREAARCMHCDCRKPVTCKLRQLSDEYQANRKRFTGPERKNLKKYIRHDLIVYEPEKCIKCGRCVEITSQYKEELGLTFIGRGFDIRIGVPFGETLQEGIRQSAFFCVENCPTGALSFKDQEEGVEYGKRMRLTKKGWSGIHPDRMIPSVLILLMIMISLFLTAQPRQPSCWSSYRGDPQLTGVSLAKVKSPLKLLWSFKTGDAVKSSPVVCNSAIYVGSNDGFLYALDLNGTLIWKFEAGNSIESPPLLIDGQVVFGTLEGTIISLDAEDGKERWRYVTEGQISGAPNAVKPGKGKAGRIIAGSYDYNLHGVEISTGKPLWKYETDNFINGTPALFGKIAIFGGCDGHLHLVNTESGQLIDKIDIGTYMASSPSVSGTRVYFGNYDGEFFCFDMKSKKMVWKTEGGGPFLSSPAVSGKIAVIGSQNKTLYGYDTGSGKILWTFKALGKIDASPVITGTQVVVASADGRLRLLDLHTGKEVWSYEVGSPMYSTPAVTSMGIVIGADDGGVYMFTHE